MRRAARAIVIHNDNLLVMHRNKFGTEYETLPGGAIEIGEETENAVIRELLEEASIVATNQRLVFVEDAGDMYGIQYVFLCDYVSGEPQLDPDSPEAPIHAMGKNLYEPKWVSLADLPQLPFVSERLKQAIIGAVTNGFPVEPVEIR